MKNILKLSLKIIAVSLLCNVSAFGQSLEDFKKIDKKFESKNLDEIQKLAKQGYMDAQGVLGIYYSNGIRVKKNKHLAEKWYLLAAKQGHEEAQYNLGQMYRNGHLGNPNYKSALYWYERAAENKVVFAPSNIAGMHYQGIGASVNYIMATKWMIIAKHFGDNMASKNLSILRRALTATDYKKSQILARSWLKKHHL